MAQKFPFDEDEDEAGWTDAARWVEVVAADAPLDGMVSRVPIIKMALGLSPLAEDSWPTVR